MILEGGGGKKWSLFSPETVREECDIVKEQKRCASNKKIKEYICKIIKWKINIIHCKKKTK